MIQLENKKIKAKISPEMGMAFTSFKVLDREILDQDLKNDFLKTRKGLGPIILPYFNQASPITYDDVNSDDEKYKLFPHIKYLQEIGISHPFQHGIGRYVAWNYQLNDNTIIGTISGEDKVNGFTLKQLNGFDFYAKVIYRLFEDYVSIKLEVSGEMPVASGIHFYYDLVNENSAISLNAYQREMKINTIYFNKNHDDVLTPISDKSGFSHVLLRTNQYNLLTKFMVEGDLDKVFESLIIFSNMEKNFVCIEPISYKVGEKNTKLKHFGEIQLIPGT
jgi:galactose mutarotase-like enzyme